MTTQFHNEVVCLCEMCQEQRFAFSTLTRAAQLGYLRIHRQLPSNETREAMERDLRDLLKEIQKDAEKQKHVVDRTLAFNDCLMHCAQRLGRGETVKPAPRWRRWMIQGRKWLVAKWKEAGK